MNRRGRPESGFTYVEVLLAIVILAGAVTSMGLALESSRGVGGSSSWQRTAHYLVQDGVAWARSLRRRDPDVPSSFGREVGETTATYDDVDDLDGTVESPPIDRDDEVFGAEWKRSFTVESVDPADPSAAVTRASSNLMRLRVQVLRHGAAVAEGVALFWRTP